MPRTISTYVIFKYPQDYPNKYVVRRWDIVAGFPEPNPQDPPIAVVDTVGEARSAMPGGLTMKEQHTEDGAVLIETWA